jgi:putative PIN family toxin of toxin-antitoxin system
VIAAVLDTNVLASGIVGVGRSESTPGELFRRWRTGAFILVVSEPIMAELVRTFTNPYFAARIDPVEVEATLARVRAEAQIQPMTVHVSGIATHPEDDVILSSALSARARYLVTGDKKLQERSTYYSTLLVSPRQFLDVLDRDVVE